MSKEKICGIYCIENLVNGKKYIGQSVNIKDRWYHHKSNLNNNKHKNTYLQHAWNKYGKDNFKFYILEECDIDNLDYLEKFYIKKYDVNNRDFGYNRESGGNLKKQVSKETKLKISQNHKDVSGVNNPMYGKKISDESNQKKLNNINYINRKIKGEDNWKCNITEDVALEIKKYFSDDHKSYYGEIKEIAEKYNTTPLTVSHIKHGRTWAWLSI